MTVRNHLIALLLAGLAAPAPAQTQPVPAAKPSDAARPVNERDPSAVDVVATPVTDLNLRKGEIPPALVAAEADPYGLPGGGRCPAMAAEVRRLDAVLGDDVDIAQASRGRVSPGKVAQSVVGSFIPFRGIIREISGANEQQRRLQSAIYAGMARRSFLKGVGLQRGCPWPARPATPQILARIAAQNAAKAQAGSSPKPRR
jgi:hypothetical protein